MANRRVQIGVGLLVLAVLVGIGWYVLTAGRESTDDAQIDSHLSQVAARVGGTITVVAVDDNKPVEVGALLVQLDPRDYQVALDKARAELADAEAAATSCSAAATPLCACIRPPRAVVTPLVAVVDVIGTLVLAACAAASASASSARALSSAT